MPAPQKANFVRNPTMGDDDVDLDVRLATDEEELSVGYLDEVQSEILLMVLLKQLLPQPDANGFKNGLVKLFW